MYLHIVLYLACCLVALLSLATILPGRADMSVRTRQHRHYRALKAEREEFCHRIKERFGLEWILKII